MSDFSLIKVILGVTVPISIFLYKVLGTGTCIEKHASISKSGYLVICLLTFKQYNRVYTIFKMSNFDYNIEDE